MYGAVAHTNRNRLPEQATMSERTVAIERGRWACRAVATAGRIPRSSSRSEETIQKGRCVTCIHSASADFVAGDQNTCAVRGDPATKRRILW